MRGCRQVIVESWRTCMAPDPQAKVRSGRALGHRRRCCRARNLIDAELIGVRCVRTFGAKLERRPDAKHVSACAPSTARAFAALLAFQPCLQNLSR